MDLSQGIGKQVVGCWVVWYNSRVERSNQKLCPHQWAFCWRHTKFSNGQRSISGMKFSLIMRSAGKLASLEKAATVTRQEGLHHASWQVRATSPKASDVTRAWKWGPDYRWVITYSCYFSSSFKHHSPLLSVSRTGSRCWRTHAERIVFGETPCYRYKTCHIKISPIKDTSIHLMHNLYQLLILVGFSIFMCFKVLRRALHQGNCCIVWKEFLMHKIFWRLYMSLICTRPGKNVRYGPHRFHHPKSGFPMIQPLRQCFPIW